MEFGNKHLFALEFALRGVSNATPGTTPVTLSSPGTSTPKGPFACGSFQVHLFMSECQFTGYLYLLYIAHYVVYFLHLIRIQILTWFRKDDSTVWNKAENTVTFIQITGLHHRRALHSSPSPQGVSASLPPVSYPTVTASSSLRFVATTRKEDERCVFEKFKEMWGKTTLNHDDDMVHIYYSLIANWHGGDIIHIILVYPDEYRKLDQELLFASSWSDAYLFS